MLLTVPGNLLAVIGMLLVNAATFVLTFYLTVFEVIPEAYATIREKFEADTKHQEDPPQGEMWTPTSGTYLEPLEGEVDSRAQIKSNALNKLEYSDDNAEPIEIKIGVRMQNADYAVPSSSPSEEIWFKTLTRRRLAERGGRSDRVCLFARP